MGFWIFMLIIVLMIPAAMIGFGRLFLKKAPGDINELFGYRTKMSMKNKDTWEFAHRYFGRLWFVCGLILLPMSVIPVLFVINKDTSAVANTATVVIVVQLVLMLGPIIPTEAALKKTFDKDGKRKTD